MFAVYGFISLTAMTHIPLQAVTFDVGGTLINPWPSVGHVYAEVASRHGIPDLSPEILNERFDAAWRERKKFGYTMTAWSQLVDQTFAALTPKPPSESFFSDLYHRFSQADAWQIFDDVKPTLQTLRERGLKLGALSNWDERLGPLLQELELAKYFDAILVSIELGSHKPDPGIFREASLRLDVPPAGILHVGNSSMEDFEGARAAGFQAVLLNRAGPLEGGQLRSLAQLLDADFQPGGN